MHIFMDVMAGDQRRRALLGAKKIDREEREKSGECQPWENFADGNWNRPGCRSMDKAVHVLPYKVSRLRPPLARVRRGCGKSRTLGAAEQSVNAGDSLGGGCVQVAGARGVLALRQAAERQSLPTNNRSAPFEPGFLVLFVKALAGVRRRVLRGTREPA